MSRGQFWIYVISVLVSPLLAVQATMWLQRKRETRERKLDIFKTLMRTRASALAPDHVQALNMIDVEFYGDAKRTGSVLRAWKAYVDHLNTPAATIEIWGARREELFIDLLDAMARHLRFDFDKTDIRKTSYFPTGYGDQEFQTNRIRAGLVELLEQRRTLPVTAYPPAAPPPAAPAPAPTPERQPGG